jgi:hypothetical protein
MSTKSVCMLALLSCAFPAAQSEAAFISTYAEYSTYGTNDPIESATSNLGAIVSTVSGNDFSIPNGMASAYADTNGNLSVSTSQISLLDPVGPFTAIASFSEQYTNTTAHGLDYTLDFSTTQYLQNTFGTYAPNITGTILEMEILVDGATIWDSSTELGILDWDYHIDLNTEINTAIIDNSVYPDPSHPEYFDPASLQLVGAYQNDFFLGLLDPGESLMLEYRVSSIAYGRDAGWSSSLLSVSGNVSNAVPEPSSLILMGVGLVGLGFVRRKRKLTNA